MQLAHCTIKHGAKHYHAVRRINVSAAEIQVLQAIHGHEAVDEVVYAGMSDRSAIEEKKHLETVYGNKDETKALVDKLFPGAKPNLPETLAEVGFDVDCSVEPKRVKVAKEGEIIKPPISARVTLKAATGAAALA